MARTLVIDDDPLTEAHFASLRGQMDDRFLAQLTFARSNEAALDIILKGTEFDVSLVAIDSPAIDGLQLFQRLQNKAFRVPRVALSSGTDLSLIRRAMNDGAVDFLVKPFTGDDYAATISRVLEQVDTRRRNWEERAEYSALRREIDIAADIQQRILPREFPLLAGLEIHADMQPAKVMGGDFFDVFELDDGRVGFVVADVSGKGVPAAFYMAVARTLIRSVAMAGYPPSECLNQANQLLCAHQIPGMFVSVFYGVIDPVSGALTFSNGGHQPPYLGGAARDGVVTIEGGGGVILGIDASLPYDETTIDIGPGEFLYLCTDGVTEAMNPDREAFDETGVERHLTANRKLGAKDLVNSMNEAIKTFTRGASQHDDITSLVVRRI